MKKGDGEAHRGERGRHGRMAGAAWAVQRGPRAVARSLLRGQAGRGRRGEGGRAAALLEMDKREREDAR
jgi:hypothetical protein